MLLGLVDHKEILGVHQQRKASLEKDCHGLPKILGAMGGHVDDFHRCGNSHSRAWRAIREKIDRFLCGEQ